MNPSYVGNLATVNTTDLVGGHRNHCDGYAIQGHKLHFVSPRTVPKNNRTHVTALKPVFTEVRLQDNPVKFSNHDRFLRTGYAVTSFGIVRPLCTNQTERTVGLRLSGDFKGPTIVYRFPSGVSTMFSSSCSPAWRCNACESTLQPATVKPKRANHWALLRPSGCFAESKYPTILRRATTARWNWGSFIDALRAQQLLVRPSLPPGSRTWRWPGPR